MMAASGEELASEKLDEYAVGDTVLTTYGVGVIVGEMDGFYSVRLWRIPGKSISASALATLQTDTVSGTS
jgi:hypothetical protein